MGNSTQVNLQLHIWRYSGDFYVRPSNEHVPIHLAPPYVYMRDGVLDSYVTLCDVGDAGTKHYLGLLGGHKCGMYDVVAHSFYGPCQRLENYAVVDDTMAAEELILEHFVH